MGNFSLNLIVQIVKYIFSMIMVKFRLVQAVIFQVLLILRIIDIVKMMEYSLVQ